MPLPRDSQHPLALRTPPSAPGADANSGSGVGAVADQLASVDQTLRDISHALAHDLRTSLRHVSSYAQLLGDAANAGQHEQVMRLSHKVLDSSRRLQLLMESVSSLARLRAADLRPETVDTAVMLRGLIRERDQRSDGPRVACVLAPDLPPAWADASLLGRVWEELLDNAWRHARSHPQPRIHVTCQKVPGGQAYFVDDNGPGFDSERAGELFGLFQRAQSAPAPGLGLGLAMVRRIVECHGGRVWAAAQPGQGARFGFSLPVLDKGA